MEKSTSQTFNEEQSLQIIREMIQVSRKKVKNDGILLIFWGYAMAVMYFVQYLKNMVFISAGLNRTLSILSSLLPLMALLFTIYYVVIQRKKVQTYIGISLRYIWFCMFLCLVMINLIQFNVLHDINFMLQHPIFMVVIAFATVVTGIILRYKLLIAGGVSFAVLAYICSYFALREQILFESIAWIIAFIIPGHIMFHKRNT